MKKLDPREMQGKTAREVLGRPGTYSPGGVKCIEEAAW